MGINRLVTLFDSIKRWPRGYRMALRMVVALVIAVVTNLIISSYTDTPKMAKIRRDNHRLEREYVILQEKIAASEQILEDIKHRDHYVYRPLLGVDTIGDPDILRVGDDYYLAGTTMHSVPGLVILHSKDLVNWENVSYCFDRYDFPEDRFFILLPLLADVPGKKITGPGLSVIKLFYA